MNNQMQEEVEKLQALQKQQQKTLSARQTLDSQLSENKLVKEEMDKLEEESRVFKLIGPALVRQDGTEATRRSFERFGKEARRPSRKIAIDAVKYAKVSCSVNKLLLFYCTGLHLMTY